jgi:hypothetical protein
MKKKTDLHLKQTGTKYVQNLKSLSTNIHPPSITALEYQVRRTERAEIQLTWLGPMMVSTNPRLNL